MKEICKYLQLKNTKVNLEMQPKEKVSEETHKEENPIKDKTVTSFYSDSFGESIFLLARRYASISDLYQKFLFFTRIGLGKRLYRSSSYNLLLFIRVIFKTSETSTTSLSPKKHFNSSFIMERNYHTNNSLYRYKINNYTTPIYTYIIYMISM